MTTDIERRGYGVADRATYLKYQSKSWRLGSLYAHLSIVCTWRWGVTKDGRQIPPGSLVTSYTHLAEVLGMTRAGVMKLVKRISQVNSDFFYMTDTSYFPMVTLENQNGVTLSIDNYELLTNQRQTDETPRLFGSYKTVTKQGDHSNSKPETVNNRRESVGATSAPLFHAIENPNSELTHPKPDATAQGTEGNNGLPLLTEGPNPITPPPPFPATPESLKSKPYHPIIEAWQSTGRTLRKITKKQANKLIAAWKLCDDAEMWKRWAAKIKLDSFYQGNNDRGWKATFDFFINEEKAAAAFETLDSGKTLHERQKYRV